MKGLQLSPEQAHADGIVHFLVEPGELDEQARDYAVRLARQAPIALRGIKRAIRAAGDAGGPRRRGRGVPRGPLLAGRTGRGNGVPGGREGNLFRDLKKPITSVHFSALRLEAGVTQSTYYLRRRRQARVRRIKRLSFASLALLALVVIAVSIVYAGSPGTLAKGVQIDGVDVGGLSATEATKTLEQRAQVSSREARRLRRRRPPVPRQGVAARPDDQLGCGGRRRAPPGRRFRADPRLPPDEAALLRRGRLGARDLRPGEAGRPARPDRLGRRRAAPRGGRRPPRAPSGGRPGEGRPHPRPRRRLAGDRRRARCLRARERRPAADQGRRAEGDRADARAGRRAGAAGGLGARHARRREAPRASRAGRSRWRSSCRRTARRSSASAARVRTRSSRTSRSR